jgi:hypothetical protein
VRFEKIARIREYLSLNWPQQHVFKHRVVCDEQIWACFLNLVPSEQFWVLHSLNCTQRIAV